MSDTFNGIEVEYGVPKDGNDYRMMNESKIDRLVEEVEEKETEIELPEDIYGDEYDAVVTGEVEL